MANKTITQLDAAQSLNDNMVIAVQDTNTTYKTTLADVKAYCGAAPAGDKYKVGDRVKDDSDNDVGTVSSIFTDGNGDRYAVVCLDAVNRLSGALWSSVRELVTGLPTYANINTAAFGNGTESATANTQLILDWCSANGYTSAACSHCRSKSFTIDGTTYYGQLPNIKELIDIFSNHYTLNSLDPTSSSYTSLNFATWRISWSSTQGDSIQAWYVSDMGAPNINLKNYVQYYVVPVLEIPLED